MNGKPLQIVTINGNNIEVNEELLRKTLMKKEIKDRFVCVYSIAGAFRKGKSFLLNFFLRFMYMKYGHNDISDFLEDENIALTGFSWRSGIERDTLGILMWSDVFLHDFDNGDKVAIILLDTQGAFDHQSTVRDCASIFALSTMLSSVQIYNISQQIQENDLQHLELFIEYGKLALENSDKKPFQKLIFLIRDWCYLGDFDYGDNGGFDYILNVYKTGNNKDLTNRICQCFMKISCFLMPHPGLNVTKKNLKGSLKELSLDFLNNLRNLEASLFLPKNLLIKEVNGNQVRAKDWIQYLRSYVKVFNENNLPDPQTVFKATAEACNQITIAKARTIYNNLMKTQLCEKNLYLTEDNLQECHKQFREEALSYFDTKPKMGNVEFMQMHRDELFNDLEQDLETYKLINKGNYCKLEIALVEEANKLAQNYWQQLDENFGEETLYVNSKELEAYHFKSSNEIIQLLTNETTKNLQKYRKHLEFHLNKAYSNILKLNEAKLYRMEAKALEWLKSVKNAYKIQMEIICQNYIGDFEEKHMETKQQHHDLLNKLNDQYIERYREQIDSYFDECLKRFGEENQMKYDHLKTTIENMALSARIMFTNSLTAQFNDLLNLTADNLNLTIATTRNEMIGQFELCRHMNEEIWIDCRQRLEIDLLTISRSTISHINESREASAYTRFQKFLRFVENVSTLALGETPIGRYIIMTARLVRLALNFDINQPN